jgi:hypothetical protein
VLADRHRLLDQVVQVLRAQDKLFR